MTAATLANSRAIVKRAPRGSDSDSGESVAASRDRAVQVLVPVGGGNEKRLELGRRQEDAALEHLVKERGETARVRALGILVIAHRIAGEKQREQRAHSLDLARDVRRGESAANAIGEAAALAFERVVETG